MACPGPKKGVSPTWEAPRHLTALASLEGDNNHGGFPFGFPVEKLVTSTKDNVAVFWIDLEGAFPCQEGPGFNPPNLK